MQGSLGFPLPLLMPVHFSFRDVVLGKISTPMIGNRVPEDDNKWDLFLDLLTILDYVFAPSTNLDIVAYVRLLIGNHFTRFRELYPDCSIIPKQHYMIHIPVWMER